MSVNSFLSKENISTLWDVITDEDIFKFLSKDIQTKVLQVFTQNLKGFFDNEKIKTNVLMDMNKKYMILLLEHIKKIYPQQPNKIKIHDDIIPKSPKEAITYEEIHSDRKSQFDKDLNNRQEDFNNAMSIKVPPVPDFTDKLVEEPIMEMDKIIKEMMMQRNYEIEVINKNVSSTKDDGWLQSQETSIKRGKNTVTTDTDTSTDIDRNNVFNKKNVSWGFNETREYQENDKIMEDNIFKKLKKINNENTTALINDSSELNNFNENKLNNLENQIKILNDRVNLILNILQTK
uniref:Uncharacterized protein n=1 Tax=viral metagenome TaxID=1070528 RepID=A0A6C0IED5_9ZZZZ